MLNTSTQPILGLVRQHAEEAANLRSMRSALVAAPHIRLFQLRQFDNRLVAHLDGLAVAGESGWTMCEAALESPGIGEVFAATVRAIEGRNFHQIEKLATLVEALPGSRAGYVSAFGWVSAPFLQGTIKSLLVSPAPFQRQVGIAACAMHRVDAGAALVAAIGDADASLRARGLRVAGETGRRDLLGACVQALADEDEAGSFWAARSAVLLGDRGDALALLKDLALRAGPNRLGALRLLLKLLDAPQARLLLKGLASDRAHTRLLIQGAGVAGDPHYLPWLIKQMEDQALARLAAESFSLITGLELSKLGLEQDQAEGFASGPTDNPDDPDVGMDPDENLPWPDRSKVGEWWRSNQSRFSAGGRYFVGEPLTQDNCREVLRNGCQRQRSAAAEHLCLLQPGTPLFPTSAPAWRQLRWLGKLG